MDKEEGITRFNVKDLPTSYVAMVVSRRRGGKTTLVESWIRESHDAGKLDFAFLFSGTDAGFPMIGEKYRSKDINDLQPLLERYRVMNEYNQIADPPNRFKLKTVVVLDDMATCLKTKEFQEVLSKVACNGRHLAYKPLSLSFIIISQNLNSIPRIVRNNVDLCVFNNISSVTECQLILDEAFHMTDCSRGGKAIARQLYQDLVISEPFLFIVVECHRQNIRQYSDYIKTYVASLK